MTSQAQKKIVVLAGRHESTWMVVHALSKCFKIDHILLEEPVSRTQFLKARMRKLGLVQVVGQILFQLLVIVPLKVFSGARIRSINADLGLDDTPICFDNVTAVRSVNSQEALNILCAIRPDIVVLNGTRILSKKVLKSIPAAFINMHAGITPMYRGVHGAYWALAEGRPERCGVTVHYVDEGIDTGTVISQAVIRPGPRDNFVTYPYLQLAAGIPLLIAAIEQIIQGCKPESNVQHGGSKLWSHPTLWQYASHWIRQGIR